ncbi:MAG: hypothetical protein H7Y09_00740 [Chitinophagaceae bacterium]|nr:hypothetical protein [Anaerolineae bacterium]
MKIRFLLMIMVLSVIRVTAQSAEIGLRVVDVQRMDTAFEEINYRTAVISPNAEMIAWSDRDAVCLYTFTTDVSECSPLPPDLRLSNNIKLEWSPDNGWLVFTEDAFRNAHESDIWLFNVLGKSFLNRTEDRLYGGFISNGDQAALLDYEPIWNPVTGDLYFIRTIYDRSASTSISQSGLYRIAADALFFPIIEPELVLDLTGRILNEPFPVYPSPLHGLEGAAAISPNGTHLALLVRPNERRNAAQGVWVIDLQSGEITQLINQERDFANIGLPAYVSDTTSSGAEFLRLTTLSWANTGTGLVITLSNDFSSTDITEMAYYVDVATSDVTPIVDFSGIQDVADFIARTRDDGFPSRYDMPSAPILVKGIGGFMQPSQDIFLAFNFDPINQQSGVSAVILPPSGEEPVRLTDLVGEPLLMDFPTVGENETVIRALMFGYLVTLERG